MIFCSKKAKASPFIQKSENIRFTSPAFFLKRSLYLRIFSPIFSPISLSFLFPKKTKVSLSYPYAPFMLAFRSPPFSLFLKELERDKRGKRCFNFSEGEKMLLLFCGGEKRGKKCFRFWAGEKMEERRVERYSEPG